MVISKAVSKRSVRERSIDTRWKPNCSGPRVEMTMIRRRYTDTSCPKRPKPEDMAMLSLALQELFLPRYTRLLFVDANCLEVSCELSWEMTAGRRGAKCSRQEQGYLAVGN